ncbi:hypothetical protein K4F52_002809 [Lecanicillium sp. MT-2017a]|nr:hypothetical protein K4F52_002809 [Lecanicillium sp. MT-2017a]
MDRAPIPSPTKTQHKVPYPAIDPTLPRLSQSGRAVLVTGSSSGIGYFIARAFAKAGAAAVVLTGRQETSLNDAADTLREQYPNTKIIAKVLDIADSLEVEQLWKSLDEDNIVIHVLVLSAARVQKPGPILEVGRAEILADFATNIGGNMVCTELFYHQSQRNKDTKLALVNVSSKVTHFFDATDSIPNYAVTKSASTMMMQQIARLVKPDDLQVVSFDPGSVFTTAAKNAGFTEVDFAWDHPDLAGHFAVWAASEEAKFLHGRFVWARWDVDELSHGPARRMINSDPNYLKVGVKGL